MTVILPSLGPRGLSQAASHGEQVLALYTDWLIPLGTAQGGRDQGEGGTRPAAPTSSGRPIASQLRWGALLARISRITMPRSNSSDLKNGRNATGGNPHEYPEQAHRRGISTTSGAVGQ